MRFRDGVCGASCSTVVCPPAAGQREGNGASQTVHCKDHTACLTLDPGLHALWPVSVVPLVHGICHKQTATDGFLKIKCWLSTTDSLPQVCSWQQEMVNKHGGLHKRGGICMLRLEDTTNAIVMPRTQHPSAGWWIPLIQDLWCYILCSACTPSVPPI